MKEREYKWCPDCAEQVLVAARRCRFCGYRFDTGRRDSRPATGPLSRVIRRTPEPSLPDQLADWGLCLGTVEEVRFFLLIDLDGEAHFMLVSSERLVFVPVASHGEPGSVLGVNQTRRRLELNGVGFRHVVAGLSHAETERLGGHLSTRVVGNR